ncbi:MAG: hypothetical protein M1549_03995 [Candidatus Dependentiae bacterium]|nr:hypothetical protein [Candidatus Dependentiae bacterium]
MRKLSKVVLAALLVAGTIRADQIIMELQNFRQNDPHMGMRWLTEALRFELCELCNLLAASFEHRNITPEEVQCTLIKLVERYRRTSAEVAAYYQRRGIPTERLYLEKEPMEFARTVAKFSQGAYVGREQSGESGIIGLE